MDTLLLDPKDQNSIIDGVVQEYQLECPLRRQRPLHTALHSPYQASFLLTYSSVIPDLLSATRER